MVEIYEYTREYDEIYREKWFEIFDASGANTQSILSVGFIQMLEL